MIDDDAATSIATSSPPLHTHPTGSCCRRLLRPPPCACLPCTPSTAPHQVLSSQHCTCSSWRRCCPQASLISRHMLCTHHFQMQPCTCPTHMPSTAPHQGPCIQRCRCRQCRPRSRQQSLNSPGMMCTRLPLHQRSYQHHTLRTLPSPLLPCACLPCTPRTPLRRAAHSRQHTRNQRRLCCRRARLSLPGMMSTRLPLSPTRSQPDTPRTHRCQLLPCACPPRTPGKPRHWGR